MRSRQKILIWFLLITIVLSVSCAPGNVRYDEIPAGFWAGLWHGLIIVVSFIISLFSDNVYIYEMNNTGNWYNFGFLVGIIVFFTSVWTPGKKKKR